MSLYKRTFVSEFSRYFVALLSSNALAQGIAIAVYPLLTRLFSPEAFGEFNLFLTIAGILTLLTTGRYELAIVLPKSERQAAALFQLSLLLTVVCSVLFFFIVSFWKESIALLFRKPQLTELTELLPFLPYYLLLGGLWQILNYYFIRQKRYYNISINTFTQSILGSILKVWFGFKGFLQSGLVWGQFGGQLIATIVSAVAGRKSFKLLKHWDKQAIAEVAKTYSNFPKYELPHGLINSIGGNLPVLLLSAYFDMNMIGLFSLTFMLGFRPINLFSQSMYQVLYKKIAERIQQKMLIWNNIFQFCKFCVCVILPVFILFAFIPNDVFGWLFGAKWTSIGFYLKIMLPWLFFVVGMASLSFIPDLFFKQKTAMLIEITYMILRIISLIIGIYLKNFDLAIILYCSVSAVMNVVLLLWYYSLIRKYEKSLML